MNDEELDASQYGECALESVPEDLFGNGGSDNSKNKANLDANTGGLSKGCAPQHVTCDGKQNIYNG